MLPRRRRIAFHTNCLFVGIAWFLGFVGIALSSFDSIFMLLVMLPFLAIFQWACVIYNIFRGSRKQLLYLGASILFLAIYIGCIYFNVRLPGTQNGSEKVEFLWMIGPPLVFAAYYCYLLYTDHPKGYRNQVPQDDTLDGELLRRG